MSIPRPSADRHGTVADMVEAVEHERRAPHPCRRAARDAVRAARGRLAGSHDADRRLHA